MGGVIRDDNGNWVCGVVINLGHYSVVMAEAWGVWHVLRLAWDCGIRKAILALDNLLVVKLISNGSSMINMSSSLVQDIRRMLNWDWEIRIEHTYREDNRVVDAMANMCF